MSLQSRCTAERLDIIADLVLVQEVSLVRKTLMDGDVARIQLEHAVKVLSAPTRRRVRGSV